MEHLINFQLLWLHYFSLSTISYAAEDDYVTDQMDSNVNHGGSTSYLQDLRQNTNSFFVVGHFKLTIVLVAHINILASKQKF
jgi:hypothetical protein